MANFNNSQNNSREGVNINTRGLQFMNKEGFDPSTLLIGFWNEMISIKMHPALEPSKRTESKVFDYEKVISTAITAEKATILSEKIKNEIFPAIEKGEQKSVGVPVGADSLLVIGTGKKITGEIRPFIAIHKALNETKKIPEMSIFYEFNRGMTIDDYDHESGDFSVTKDIHGEFMVFYGILKNSVIGMSNSIAHSIRYVDKYFKDRLMSDIGEIANKLGVSLGGNRGSYTKRKDIFSDNDKNSGNSTDSVNIESLNNIEDINDLLN